MTNIAIRSCYAVVCDGVGPVRAGVGVVDAGRGGFVERDESGSLDTFRGLPNGLGRGAIQGAVVIHPALSTFNVVNNIKCATSIS